MTALTLDPRRARTPTWLASMAAFGVLWNFYGICQFVGTLTPAGRSAMTAGMTSAQAQVWFALPPWMSAVFAVGVFGGLLGSLALFARRKAAVAVLAASLVSDAALFSGDWYFAVFDALPGRLAILACVVMVAVALQACAGAARRRALLR